MNEAFSFHKLNAVGMDKAGAIARDFDTLLASLEERGIGGRYLAIVKTKLEEACFFAKKGMASVPENQEVAP